MLLGCCHCGEDPPSDSVPPSESVPSESVPSEGESVLGYSEITSNCISLFGCAAIPRRLTWTVNVSTGGSDCLCQYYDGSFVLDFCNCWFDTTAGQRLLLYASPLEGWYRGRVGFPPTDTLGCRPKIMGPCYPYSGTLSGSSRRYYAVISSNTIQVHTSSFQSFLGGSLAHTWQRIGAVNCLVSSMTLTRITNFVPGADGSCSWATTGTLGP